MIKSKIAIWISIAVCSLLIAATLIVTFGGSTHEHELIKARVYHVSNDGVYYTRKCKDDKHTKRFDTEISFKDVLLTATGDDSVVLDEDIVLDSAISINSYIVGQDDVQALNLNINLDLNNHKIYTNISSGTGAMINLDTREGKINLNIKNGTLYSDDLQYIFSFQNNIDATNDNAVLNLDNVVCQVKGTKVTPLYAHDTAKYIKVNASNSQFIAERAGTTGTNTGVGVFINSESEFNFTNCLFKGGDAVYVKHGTVNMTGCELVSANLTTRAAQSSDDYYAIGACLAAESYGYKDSQSNSKYTKFNITLTNCNLITGNNSNALAKVSPTADDGVVTKINNQSSIVFVSCQFDENKSQLSNYEIIQVIDSVN